MANDGLAMAKNARKDEFYTQLSDIEKELHYYRSYFNGKTVLCNCDDPFESNFFKYFVLNFNRLGLKKLIATSYVSSPIAGSQFNYYFDDSGQMQFAFESKEKEHGFIKRPYKATVTSVHDATGNGGIEMVDIAKLFESGVNTLEELEGDGDFRSDECISILDGADIVVTNPPFSLFREYVDMLMEHDKKFVIIGNMNAIHYKEIFPLLRDNKAWLGVSIHSGDRKFNVPDDYPMNAAGCGTDADGRRFIRVKGVRWYTNLDIRQRHENLILVQRYDPQKYPKYENYDAINVDKVSEIPCDYSGLMGVPDNFMDNYNPDQFEIIGVANVNGLLDGVDIIGEQWVREYKANGGTGHITANMHSLVGYKPDGKPVSYYSRIIVRNKHPEQPKGGQ